MADIERFELPREDWYDEQGRIYKDVLIINLNACEQKLFELQGLDAFDVEPPDISSIVYPDTDLTSDDSCIVNLKSFLEIINLINYPIELQISGKKIRKVSYWNSNHQYITKTNTIVNDAAAETPYVYIDLTDGNIKASNNPATAVSGILLGVFENGVIRGVHNGLSANINLMYLLANVQKDTGSATNYDVHNNPANYTNMYNSSRAVGYADGESQAGAHSITYTDYGRKL